MHGELTQVMKFILPDFKNLQIRHICYSSKFPPQILKRAASQRYIYHGSNRYLFKNELFSLWMSHSSFLSIDYLETINIWFGLHIRLVNELSEMKWMSFTVTCPIVSWISPWIFPIYIIYSSYYWKLKLLLLVKGLFWKFHVETLFLWCFYHENALHCFFN